MRRFSSEHSFDRLTKRLDRSRENCGAYDMSLNLLKEEINQTHETNHDIAQKKLILAASWLAVSLGLTSHQATAGTQFPAHFLLLAVPLVCAYSDLFYYQNMLRILVIARFIREEPEDSTLKAYEKFVDRARASEKSFLFEKVAHVGSSFILSPALVLPL
jgi:hypothetical protein